MDAMLEPAPSSGVKRKRIALNESSGSGNPPTSKSSRGHAHTQINYLARQYDDQLPLPTARESLGALLRLLDDYYGVLERNESLASNMGVRPLGLVLMKRFERLFEGPPKVLKSHGKEQPSNITWLDVVEFASNKPEQFTLGQMSNGQRVCQFYTKQCRVQISEDDFLLIQSGAPQKLIPQQPIEEDEEKELGTLEIIQKAVDSISRLSDQVSSRSKQVGMRLRARRQAIMDRRLAQTPISSAQALRASSPSNVALMNGGISMPNTLTPSQSNLNHAASSFAPSTAAPTSTLSDYDKMRPDLVKAEVPLLIGPHEALHNYPSPPDAGRMQLAAHSALASPDFSVSQISPANAVAAPSSSAAKGKARQGCVSKFPPKHPSAPTSDELSSADYPHLGAAGSSTSVPIKGNAVSSASRSANADRDDGGPYKAEMVARLEKLAKGERILPPCDRCRRLHMDCLKNLTACVGCTKKHAKCGWKEVKEEELRAAGITLLASLPPPLTGRATEEVPSALTGTPSRSPPRPDRGFNSYDMQQRLPPHQLTPRTSIASYSPTSQAQRLPPGGGHSPRPPTSQPLTHSPSAADTSVQRRSSHESNPSHRDINFLAGVTPPLSTKDKPPAFERTSSVSSASYRDNLSDSNVPLPPQHHNSPHNFHHPPAFAPGISQGPPTTLASPAAVAGSTPAVASGWGTTWASSARTPSIEPRMETFPPHHELSPG